MRALVVGLAVLPLLAVGCSSSSSGNPSAKSVVSSSSSTSSVSSSSVASLLPTHGGAPELTTQLLGVSDLPAGWSIDNSPQSESSTPPCITDGKSAFHATVKTERDFIGGSDFPRFSEQIGYFGSSDNAKTRFLAGRAVLDACKTLSFTAGGTQFTGSIGALSFPAMGDRTGAWRILLDAGSLTVALDVVVVQKSAELMMLIYGNVGSVDVGPLTTFVTKALAKLPS